jgi:hypothetical protein
MISRAHSNILSARHPFTPTNRRQPLRRPSFSVIPTGAASIFLRSPFFVPEDERWFTLTQEGLRSGGTVAIGQPNPG